MIANVSPGLSCSEHTLNTLRYADRVKELKKMKTGPVSKEDLLAQQLMLPRQKGNVKKLKISNKADELEYAHERFNANMSGKKQAPPEFHRGFSTKAPKLGGFENPKNRNAMYQDAFFDDEEVEMAREPRGHNFHPGSSNKQMAKDYDYDVSSEEDLIKLCQDHENLIDLILEEEEEVTNSHKEQLDNEVETVKEEMKLLYEVQKPNSDIKQYVETLHSVLEHKIKLMTDLKNKIEQFGEHLVQEERLSEEFRRKQEDANSMDN